MIKVNIPLDRGQKATRTVITLLASAVDLVEELVNRPTTLSAESNDHS